MQFSCSTEKLIEALQIVTKAIPARTTNDVLEGILLNAEGDTLTLTCSDERITIVTRLFAVIKEAGSGIVPGKLFNEMIRRLQEGNVTVTMNDRFGFNIRSAGSRMNISGQDGSLFPALPHMTNEREVSLPQNLLRDMIQKTEFAIAAEDAREMLTGCYLEIQNGVITMVALDGYRMALRTAQCGNVLDQCSAIIPGRAVGDIGKLLSDDESAFASLALGGNKLHIGLGDTDIYVILVEGQYIDYRRIMPTQFATTVTLDLEPFRRCVDRAALIAREGTNNILVLRISGNDMTIEAHSQIGDIHEELYTEKEGADVNIAFNVRYIMDVVRYIDSERVILKMNSPISPCIITPVGDEDYLHLVLPVRTAATN